MVGKLMEVLREKHGQELDIKNHVYYLFLKDGLFSVYFDKDENQIKVDVEFLPEELTFVYHSDKSIDEAMEGWKK